MISCAREPEGLKDLGHKYFPLRVGSWHLYQVDSTYWDDFTGQMYEYRFYVLEVVESQFTDAEGKPAYRLERFYRNNDTTSWQLRDVWFFNVSSSMVQRVEENIRYIKLIFPVKEGARWDGNAMNYLGTETYTYVNVHKPFTIDTYSGSTILSSLYNSAQQDFTFKNFSTDSSVTVMHSNQTTLIDEDIRYEVYAAHVGMIYKFHRVVRKDYVTGSITRGVQTIYRLHSYKIQ